MNEKRADICRRHTEEWRVFRETYLRPCLESGDESQAKFVKVVADSLRIAQESERRVAMFGEDTGDDEPNIVEWSE